MGSWLWKGVRELLGKEELQEEDSELPEVSLPCHICSPLCCCYFREAAAHREGVPGPQPIQLLCDGRFSFCESLFLIRGGHNYIPLPTAT